MKVFLIEAGTMGSSKILNTAYTDIGTCELICNQKDEEWKKHKTLEAEGEEISNNRVIVDGRVYDLNKTECDEFLAKQILKKLSKEEIKALKKYFSSN